MSLDQVPDPNRFSKEETLASIVALYTFGADTCADDIQQQAAEAFCKLFDILNPAEFAHMGILLSYGEGDGH